MPSSLTPSAEQITEHFIGYICENKSTSYYVRRVAGWLGFITKGIERIADDWGILSTRQLWFSIKGKRYKVRFNHRFHGIEIVRMQARNRDGRVAVRFCNLNEAQAFYKKPNFA